MSVVKIYNAADARTTILARKPWEDQEMPPRVLDGIERIFGERLAPAEAVARILADVRRRGDAALIEWSARIDGRAPLWKSPVAIGAPRTSGCPARNRPRSIWPRNASRRSIASSRWIRGSMPGQTARWDSSSGRWIASAFMSPAAPRRCRRRCSWRRSRRVWPAWAR